MLMSRNKSGAGIKLHVQWKSSLREVLLCFAVHLRSWTERCRCSRHSLQPAPAPAWIQAAQMRLACLLC